MKIKIKDLSKMIKEQVAPQFDRDALRKKQAQTILDATDLTNAEAAIKVLARQATDPISPGQAELLKLLKGKTSQATLRSILTQLFIDGLNGKPVLGYMTMTPNNTQYLTILHIS